MSYAILYLRPDGYWIAGKDFEDAEEADTLAKEQLPSHVKWIVVSEDSDDFRAAVALEAKEAW